MKALLLGDVCPTAIASAALFAKQDIPTLFDDTLSLFQNSDFSFVNLECAITDSEGAITKFGPNLKAPKETAAVLKTVGVDVCGLSNNHIFDFGIQGAKDTMEALDACGIAYTGFGANETDAKRNYVMEKDGQKIALIAVCEHEYSYALEDRMGSRGFDPFESVLEVQKAKAECDRVIVLYHGGKEQCRYPSPRLLKACRAMADHGADLILCQHSHCIGCYEEYNGCHILYGQGNFHFVYPETQNDGWRECLAVYYDTVSDTIEFVPVQQTDTGITLAKGEEKNAILADFAKRNEELANGEWKQGWHAFCEMKRPSYEKAIHFACLEESTERQNHHFAHYLDCEAHTDVWRELFPTYNQTNEK